MSKMPKPISLDLLEGMSKQTSLRWSIIQGTAEEAGCIYSPRHGVLPKTERQFGPILQVHEAFQRVTEAKQLAKRRSSKRQPTLANSEFLAITEIWVSQRAAFVLLDTISLDSGFEMFAVKLLMEDDESYSIIQTTKVKDANVALDLIG